MASEADRERDISYDDAEGTSVLMQRSKGILKKKKKSFYSQRKFSFTLEWLPDLAYALATYQQVAQVCQV